MPVGIMEEEAEVSAVADAVLQEAEEFEHRLSDRGVTSVADASWVPGRVSQHTVRRWDTVSGDLAVLIRPSGAVVSLQPEWPTVASTDPERSTNEKIALPEMVTISEIVSKTAVQTPPVTMSLGDARPIGIAIGTEVVIIGGMAIVAVLLMAHGSSTISDSIHTIIGTPTAIPMMDTPITPTHMDTMRANTRAIPIITIRAPTARPINPPTRPLPQPK